VAQVPARFRSWCRRRVRGPGGFVFLFELFDAALFLGGVLVDGREATLALGSISLPNCTSLLCFFSA
jgi:hypothetical protein